MKRAFRISVAFVSVFSLHVGLRVSAWGQSPPTPTRADGARLKFSEMVFDFGKVRSTDMLRHDFIVTNTGTAELEISDVSPTCGCTVAGSWDHRIAPGKSGKIPIQFNPGDFNGPVVKTVTVTCNDPSQTKHTLEIRATIWRPLEVQPPSLYFAPVEDEAISDTKVAHITSNLDEPLVLEMPQGSNPDFKLELKPTRAGREFDLHVTYAGPVTNTTPQNLITIKTSSADVPVIQVKVALMPQPALAAIPPQINLSATQMREGFRQNQIILNSSSAPLKLTSASVNAEGVGVEITEPRPGKLFMLNVSFPPGFQIKPGVGLELTVRTSNPKHPVISVPIALTAAEPGAANISPATSPSGSK